MIRKIVTGVAASQPHERGINARLLGPHHDGLRSRMSICTQLLPHLNGEEREFMTLVTDGNVEQTHNFINSHGGLNINCENFRGYTALDQAVRSENVEMVDFLLELEDVDTGDALLHASHTGRPDIVRMLLDRLGGSVDSIPEEKLHASWDSADFTVDITPLTLAAHDKHYEVVQLLLERGFTIDHPHPPSCFCEEKCEARKLGESLSESKARYHAYQAIVSPVYLCQAYDDPLYQAFTRTQEICMCAEVEREFKLEYLQLADQCRQFSVELLRQCRTTEEVLLLLNRRDKQDTHSNPKLKKYNRVDLALRCDQKEFIANPNCQQVLRSAWLEGWQDWKSLGFFTKLSRLLPRILLLPLMAIAYWVTPKSDFTKPWRSPINKFFNFAASYLLFLAVLLLQNALDSDNSGRGPPDTGLEWYIALYILALLWRNVKTLWSHGPKRYCQQAWNVYDALMLLTFLGAFSCWLWALLGLAVVGEVHDLPRNKWSQYDPKLVSEVLYAVAIIFAFGKLLYFFQIGHHLGPLQVSLSRMAHDIGVFMMMFMLVLVSFSIGLHKLYHHYKGQVKTLDGEQTKQSNAFESVEMTLSTLYWAIYGYSPPYYADVVLTEYSEVQDGHNVTVYNHHQLTETVGHTLFAVYYISGIIIMFNMLIAMMSTSFSSVQGNADVEWKFARTKIWMIFFEEGGTMPPPFNLMPSPKSFYRLGQWLVGCVTGDSRTHCTPTRCCYIDDDEDVDEDEEKYQVLMSQLVQRCFSQSHQNVVPTPASADDVEQLSEQVHELRKQLRPLVESSRSIRPTPRPSVRGNLLHPTMSNRAP